MRKLERGESLRGRISRLTIDLIYRRNLSADGMLNHGMWLAHRRSIWRPSKGLKLRKFEIEGMKAEWLETENGKKDHVILHLHGGGYVVGYMDLYRFVAAKYAKISGGANILSIDYRHGPDHVYPAALEDGLKAWDYLINQGFKEEQIIVVGDSAGGNLTVALTLKLREDGRKLPKAIIILSPWLDLTCSGPSYDANRLIDPIFGNKEEDQDFLEGKKLLLTYIGDADLTNPYVSPIYGNFHDFPPTLIQVGTHELIESDSLIFYEKAKEAGVEVTLSRFEGMFHVFQILVMMLPESKKAWEEIGQFITDLWS